jgi:hypothetical protein
MQLTDCRVLGAYYTLNQCLEMLRQTPNLVTCELWLKGPDDTSAHPLIYLSQLRTLQINIGTEHAPLLACLCLPALCHLGFNQVSEVWPQSEFVSFLSRSACPLKKLSLDLFRAPISDDEFIECLQLTPMLIELAFGRHHPFSFTAATLARLAHRRSDDGQIVPKLEILKFHRPDLTTLYDNGFVDMIQSRWRISSEAGKDNAARIKSLALRPRPGVILDERALTVLRVFGDEGLGLNFEEFHDLRDNVLDD